MRLASFILKDQKSVGFSPNVQKTLKSIPGVSDVLIGDVADTCSIVFDEVTVSTLMLRTALQTAGYDCQLEEPVPVKTSCCGGCS